MSSKVIHISEAEAERDFRGLLARAREGTEIVIDSAKGDVPLVLCSRPERRPRLLSESIALATEHGSTVTLDEDFSRDLEEIIHSHSEPLNPPTWD